MTFRELPVGARFVPATAECFTMPSDFGYRKTGAGQYQFGGWTYCIRSDRRDFEVIRIDTLKEGEK